MIQSPVGARLDDVTTVEAATAEKLITVQNAEAGNGVQIVSTAGRWPRGVWLVRIGKWPLLRTPGPHRRCEPEGQRCQTGNLTICQVGAQTETRTKMSEPPSFYAVTAT